MTKQKIESEILHNGKNEINHSLAFKKVIRFYTLPILKLAIEAQQTKVLDRNNLVMNRCSQRVISLPKPPTLPCVRRLLAPLACLLLQGNACTTPRSSQRLRSNQIRGSREQTKEGKTPQKKFRQTEPQITRVEMREEADVRKRKARNREQKKENKKTPLLFALCQILFSKTKNLCRSINNSPKNQKGI